MLLKGHFLKKYAKKNSLITKNLRVLINMTSKVGNIIFPIAHEGCITYTRAFTSSGADKIKAKYIQTVRILDKCCFVVSSELNLISPSLENPVQIYTIQVSVSLILTAFRDVMYSSVPS